MKWFTGSINEAVATSKSRKAVFVVFIEGKDDTSAQFAQTIDTTEVSSRLEEDNFVVIRLESGSEAYRFFAQIYQLVPVPSLFFIGENGTPLEIIAGNTTAVELASKIDNVLTKAGKNSKQSSMNLIDAEQKATATTSSNNNIVETVCDTKETKVNTDLVSIPNDTPDNDKDETKATTSGNTENQDKDNEETSKKFTENKQESQTKELTAEEKLERARKLIELQRKQRIEEEEKKEREREIERRKTGRDVQKMRQMQHEIEIKHAQEERKREMAAEAAAREKVRLQIAQDKLERKQKELALQQQMQQQQQQQQQQQCQELPKSNPSTSNATVTRIQFRLPSGNSHTGQFEPASTLGALRTYVVENIELPFQQFTMSTSFPRRELTNEEDDKTLLDLELVPTAVILILPLKNSNVTTAITSTQYVAFPSRFLWPFFTVFNYVYNYIVGFFSGTNRGETQHGNSGNDSTEANNNPDRATSPNRRNVVQSSRLFRRYLGNQGGTTIRTEGNIHRLHSGGDDDDENNTWNGNSTQQNQN